MSIKKNADKAEESGVAPATEFEASGAPAQIVPDVDPAHPAVDNDPRKGTTPDMNKIDFNTPAAVQPEHEQVEENLQAKD